MFDMGAEPYLVGGVLLGSLAQRLVRLNCGKCRQPYKPTAEEILLLKFSPAELESGKFMKGAGCAECKNTGYKGRIGIFELILGTPEFRAAVARNVTFAELNEVANQQGYRTMLEDGKAKAAAGWTTPSEVMRAVMTVAM
jgi:type II secretory ATPase GspE/PulE/Tfp pilus assembly ATPase PilB-like protein